MAKVLLVEESKMLSSVIAKLLDEEENLEYDIVDSYTRAEEILKENAYKYAITDLIFSDAADGQIIALLNRHKVAPIIFTNEISNEFIESFEESNIVDYVLKERYENVKIVVKKIIELEKNEARKVLIVGKSLTFRYFLRNILHLHNLDVIQAETPADALSKVEKESAFNLIIIDECSSDKQELAFLKTLRRRYQSEEYPVLVLNDPKDVMMRSILLKEGANDFLLKPFSRDEFYTRVYSMIR